MRFRRRDFLKVSAATAASLTWGTACSTLARPTGRTPFRHGVASGDPLADRVVLWTRVTPSPADSAAVPVEWAVARDPGLRDIVARGEALASPERDFTVKLDAAGLEPGTTWYYGFRSLGHTSPSGRTRTLPTGSPGRVRLGFCSCACLPWGFFNAYGHLAQRDDLDAVLHLGDYLYEYANGAFGDGSDIGRVPRPDREIVSLADYRERHAQYKADPDSQALHAGHPVIAVWDDHELANDAWKGGAQNHQPERGGWAERRESAVRAYFEWMPIREAWDGSGDPMIYRGFRFGDLVDLSMLDTRLVGRDRPVAREEVAALADPARSILGAEQERWLFDRLVTSQRDGVAWRVLGQQVMLAPVQRRDGSVLSTDKWDGYPACRARLFDTLERHGIRDTVVLTGDLHSSWALDLARDPFSSHGYDAQSGRGSLGVEFAVPGISSPGIPDPVENARVSAEILAANPHLRWVDFLSQGYALLDVDRERAQCEWYYVDTVRERRAGERFAKGFRALRGRPYLNEVVAHGAPSPA
jgi:alkaline phosphatase D